MAQEIVKSGYTALIDRLNRSSQGAPFSDTLFQILQVLFSEHEARLVALLPIKPFTAPDAAKICRMKLSEARKVLEALADRAILVDADRMAKWYTNGITLRSRPERVITPLSSANRVVVLAIERGHLQNLIFDNRALWNHRAMAAILGVILRLPPFKQAMASRQLKSHYLEALFQKIKI
jgi:hypothetical protein